MPTLRKSLTVFLTFLVSTIAVLFFVQSHYGFVLSNNWYNVNKLEKHVQTESQRTVLFFRKNGCADCISINSYMSKTLFTGAFSTDKAMRGLVNDVVVIDVYDPAAKHYIAEYNLTEVPTMIILEGGKEVSRYSGTDIEKIDAQLEKAI